MITFRELAQNPSKCKKRDLINLVFQLTADLSGKEGYTKLTPDEIIARHVESPEKDSEVEELPSPRGLCQLEFLQQVASAARATAHDYERKLELAEAKLDAAEKLLEIWRTPNYWARIAYSGAEMWMTVCGDLDSILKGQS